MSLLVEGESVWWNRKFKDLNSNELEFTLHDSKSSIISLRLGQLGFHSLLLADEFSHEGLSDSNSLLVERSEYV
jgi:hypothetical protein